MRLVFIEDNRSLRNSERGLEEWKCFKATYIALEMSIW